MSEVSSELDPSYVAGLLDAAGRVRFTVSRQEEGTFTVRPHLRIYPNDNEFRTAAIGSFLDDQQYQYRLAKRNDAPPYFILNKRSDLEDLLDYLAGESATLVRELEFVTTTFAEEFDFDILSPRDAYRFLLTRDALRYDWRPRGSKFLTADEFASEFGPSSRDVEVAELPVGPLRTDTDTEWFAGFVDGNGRFRPSISDDPASEVRYSLYPSIYVTMSGTHPATIKHFTDYLADHDLEYNESSQQKSRLTSIDGTASLYEFLHAVGPHLLILRPFVDQILEDIIPRFQAGEHKSKGEFYRLLQDMAEIGAATYGPYNPRKYNLEFFYEEWKDDRDFDIEVQPSKDA